MLALTVVLACSDYDLKADNDAADTGEAEPTPDGLAPDIEVSPPALSLDPTGVGCETSDPVTITNVGSATLTVSSVELSGDAGFAIEDWSGTLSPEEEVTLEVVLVPTAEQAHTGTITVSSNDPDEGVVEVPVDGEGSGEGVQTDSYTQNGAGEVDVLFVIDNSGSMTTHQEKVEDELASFFNWFQTLALDYHIGVITSDMVCTDQAGRLQGSPTYVTNATSNVESELADAVSVGENDCGAESGLGAMEQAFTEPLLSGHNAGFLRDDAFLSVVLLSDEPEQSSQDAQHYIDFLLALKGDSYLLSVSAIVGDYGSGCDNWCGWLSVDADPGNKYIEVQQAYPGVFESICECSFAESLEDIGWTSAGYRSTFPLSRTPSDSSAITVEVDGSSASGWSYDSAANAVEFTAGNEPDAFSAIDIQYPVDGGC